MTDTTIVDQATANEAANTPETPATDASATSADLPETDTPSAAENPEAAEVTNLNDFWASVETAVKAGTTDFSGIETEYSKLTRKGKMQAQHGVKARTFAVLEYDDFKAAKSLGAISKALGATSGGSTGEAADPSEELVNRIAGIYLAYHQLMTANSALKDRVEKAVQDAAATADAIPNHVAKRLVDTKMGRKPREGSGTRHNVGRHISQVFADLPEGTFLDVKQICDAKSEEYGDDVPAFASVSTHLKSGKFEQTGLEVVEQDKKLGVRKGAATVEAATPAE